MLLMKVGFTVSQLTFEIGLFSAFDAQFPAFCSWFSVRTRVGGTGSKGARERSPR